MRDIKRDTDVKNSLLNSLGLWFFNFVFASQLFQQFGFQLVLKISVLLMTLSCFQLYSVLIILKTYFSVIFKGFGAENRFDDGAISASLILSL